MHEDSLIYFLKRINDELNPDALKFYNAYDSPKGSLTDRVQVSIIEPADHRDDHQVHVFKCNSVDYHFRNLKFQNVLVNVDSNRSEFVFPVKLQFIIFKI